MKNQSLPNRVFNSPLIEFANFANGSSINLIRLIKPYSNGDSFAIYLTSEYPRCKNRLFKTFEDAKENFESLVSAAADQSLLITKKETGN